MQIINIIIRTAIPLQIVSYMEQCKVQKKVEREGEREGERPQQPSSWTKLVNGIIRPQRANYNEAFLGGEIVKLRTVTYFRQDAELQHEQKTITLTTYQPERKNMWIILYLHGMSASRAEALTIIRYLHPELSLACFDFLGCGHNYQQDSITLGVREAEQVQTVVSYIELLGFRVILWGRSMGAATALKFGRAPIIVADSSFCSFRQLCKDVAKQHLPFLVPDLFINCLFPCFYCRLRSDIMQQAKFDIDQLDIVQQVARINPQTLIVFMSGKDDKLIPKKHSKKLYQSFTGERKHLQVFRGEHNCKRPVQVYEKIMDIIIDFIRQHDSKMNPLIYTNTKVGFEVY